MPLAPEHWQIIGWDGITVRLPRQWQPTVILHDYLFFEHEGRPVFEIKWRHAGRRFAPEDVLLSIGKTLRHDHSSLREWKVPPALAGLAGPFTVTGFQMREGTLDSRGLLLYCPECRRATLLRVYGEANGDGRTLDLILASFADHADGDDLLWAVYDIRCLLPARARLAAHEFQAGRYILTFSLDDTRLTLFRFKPAAVLLRNRDLPAFGAQLAGTARRSGSPCPDASTWVESASGPGRLIRRLQRKPVWSWLKLWHIPEENVILAVKGEGKKGRPDTALLENITRRYAARQAV